MRTFTICVPCEFSACISHLTSQMLFGFVFCFQHGFCPGIAVVTTLNRMSTGLSFPPTGLLEIAKGRSSSYSRTIGKTCFAMAKDSGEPRIEWGVGCCVLLSLVTDPSQAQKA